MIGQGAGSLEQVADIDAHEILLRFPQMPPGVMFSAFRGFSAPVIVTTDLGSDELARLMVCDSDAFNRWEASQQLASRVMLAMLAARAEDWDSLQQPLISAFLDLLSNPRPDHALVAEMLVLPGEKYLAEMLEQADVHAVREVRETLKLAIADRAEALLLQHYRDNLGQGEYRPDADAIARRRLKNICLSYLLQLEKPDYLALCREQFEQADNMTDQITCLQAIVHYRNELRDDIVTRFYQQWQDTALVVDKWFSALGSSIAENALDDIRLLFEHPAYTLHNPNRARSLLGALMANSRAFHQADGAGYAFAADKILALDAINPQVAARLANPFVHWRKLVPALGRQMKAEVEKMLASGDLSNDLNELLTTSLKD